MQLKTQNAIVITIVLSNKSLMYFHAKYQVLGSSREMYMSTFTLLQEEVWRPFWQYIKCSEVNVASDTIIPFLGI